MPQPNICGSEGVAGTDPTSGSLPVATNISTIPRVSRKPAAMLKNRYRFPDLTAFLYPRCMTQKYDVTAISSKNSSIVTGSPARNTPSTTVSVSNVQTPKLRGLASCSIYPGIYMDTANHINAAKTTNRADMGSARNTGAYGP